MNLPELAGMESDNQHADVRGESEIDLINNEMDENETKRSPWWKYYIEISLYHETFAKCKFCPTKYKTSGKTNSSTGNLKKHILRHHPDKLLDCDSGSAETEAFVFAQENFRKALLNWIILCDQPFTVVQDQPFVDLIHTLNLDATIVTDKTIKSDVIEAYEKKFIELKADVAKIPGKMSLSMDAWSSKNVLPFMAIRGHWLNENWEYRSELLDFTHVVGDHSGENHSVILADCLFRLGIPFSKILGITLDNASCNDTLFDFLVEYGLSTKENHVRCLAHILNLSAQDILRMLQVPQLVDAEDDIDLDSEVLDDIDLNETIDDYEEEDVDDGIAIVTLRTLVKKIRKSVKLRQKLNKLCGVYKVKYLVPIIDVATRWNSSYQMITRAEQLKVPLKALCQNERNLRNLYLSTSHWKQLSEVRKLLQKFDRATKLISMERHSTISSYLPTLDWLILSLNDYIAKNSGPLTIAVQNGLDKLKKYELDITTSLIPFIASFLNPALKSNYFKEHEKYSNYQIRQIVNAISEYVENKYSCETAANPTTSKRKLESDSVDSDDDELFAHMYKRTKIDKTTTEIRKYMNLPLAKKKVQLDEFWKAHQMDFPILSQMARDFLPVQSGSVAVERDFSTGVDVVTANRCSLQPESIRAIMCLKSWLLH